MRNACTILCVCPDPSTQGPIDSIVQMQYGRSQLASENVFITTVVCLRTVCFKTGELQIIRFRRGNRARTVTVAVIVKMK